MNTDNPLRARRQFDKELVAVIPELRAFATKLCRSPEVANDLVQETLVKTLGAWESYRPGSCMRAWAFTILRNTYFAEQRRNRFRGAYDETAAERILVVAAGQEYPLHLGDLHRILLTLTVEQQEVVLLVGVAGYSYEEAAQICGCALGTIKSRIGRARSLMSKKISTGKRVPKRSVDDPVAFAAMLQALDAIIQVPR